MFDKKKYVREKILTKLSTTKLYQGSSQKHEINDLIDSLPNLDMIAYKGETFEDSTVGWLSFCKTIDFLLKNNKEINKQNLIDNLYNMDIPKFNRSLNVQYDYSKYEEDPIEKLNRLSKIAEVIDVVQDVEYEYLTDEGFKAIGVINRNETKLDAEDVVIDPTILMPTVTIDDNELSLDAIKSPFTGKSDVAKITTDIWMDLDNEKYFRVKINRKDDDLAIS